MSVPEIETDPTSIVADKRYKLAFLTTGKE